MWILVLMVTVIAALPGSCGHAIFPVASQGRRCTPGTAALRRLVQVGRELQAPWAIPSETRSHKQTKQESNAKRKPLGDLGGRRLTPCCVEWQVGYL